MIKRTLLLLAAIVASAAACTCLAQQKQGRWTIYPTVGDTYDNIVETDDKAYMLTAGKLYHHSFTDNETYAYNAANKLSDGTAISGMYYNYDNGYLLIAYTSGNIDLLFDDGSVVNLPEIKDAILTTGHGINHVSFADNRIYVATEFGMVIYDDQRYEVIESGIYDTPTTFIFPMGDTLLLIRSDRSVYYAPLSGRHTRFDVFKSFGTLFHGGEVNKLSETTLLYTSLQSGSYNYYAMTFDFAAGTGKIVNQFITGRTYPAIVSPAGIFAQTATDYYFIDTNAKQKRTAIPAALKNKRAYTTTSLASVWTCDADGLARYDVSESTPTQLMAPYRPNGFTVTDPVLMKFSNDGQRLYVADTGPSFQWGTPGDNYTKASYLDIVENGDIRDAAVQDADSYTDIWPDWLTDPATGRVASNSRFVEDPDDPSIYYVANNNAGLIAVKDGKVIYVFNRNNSPVNISWRQRTMDVNIDNMGNLWMGHGYVPGVQAYTILPAERRRQIASFSKLPDSTVKGYWTYSKALFGNDLSLSRDARSMFAAKSGLGFFYPGNYGYGIIAYDTNGTLTTADDRTMQRTTFTDTEGNLLNYPYIHTFAEDHNGQIWVGTSQGLFIIQNPEDYFSSDFRVKRPIVARNDGTEYGDYLMDAQNVYSISVDPSNRKWIATSTSGVYLVSADGTEILANYTSDNSVLPSDLVWSVACSPFDNNVFFGTSNGIVSYASDSAPASDDFSNVYAYPNPVRPDYTGWITVTGLMDSSLVKIADTAGNVFFQGRSEGGIVSWDGCGPDGNRVRSGVYLVFASQSSGNSSSGVVTKIMIVN